MAARHVIPRFSRYYTNPQGHIFNCEGRRMKIHRRSKANPNQWRIKLLDDSGKRRNVTVARAVLAAKDGKWPTDFEDACHISGDSSDNSFANLRRGCRLNNIIDEISIGRLKSSPFYLVKAGLRCFGLALWSKTP